MATRGFFVSEITKLGYKPNNLKYDFFVKKQMLKKFQINETEVSKQDYEKIENEASSFAYKVKAMYVKEFKYNYERMFDKKKKWFSEKMKNPLEKPSPPTKGRPKGKKKKKGRPTKPYNKNVKGGTQQWAKASKKEKEDVSLEQQIHTTLLKANADGNENVAYVLNLLKQDPEGNASKIRSFYENPQPPPIIVLSPEECLATLLDLKLTEREYQKLRNQQKAANAKIYVSYFDLWKVKKKCEPENIDSTSKKGEISVPMQDVCNHQISKIMKFPEVIEQIKQLNESGRQYKLEMYGKYGADGTPTDADYQTADAGEFLYLNKCLF